MGSSHAPLDLMLLLLLLLLPCVPRRVDLGLQRSDEQWTRVDLQTIIIITQWY